MTEWYGRLERFAASPGTALARMRAILELDVREVLPLVTAPTLVIQNLGRCLRAGGPRPLPRRAHPEAQLLERDSADHWPVPDPDLLAAIEEFITGTRVAEAEVDRILTTVLFVDVVGSTEHVSELGDRRWQTLLDQFVAVVQRELLTHRGVLIERPATASSPPSTGRRGRSDAPGGSATPCAARGSRCGAACTPAR